MFAIRFILSMFIVRNYDHPDEYWQGPEIAHYLVFGFLSPNLDMVTEHGNGLSRSQLEIIRGLCCSLFLIE